MFYKLSIICVIIGIVIFYMCCEEPFNEGMVHGRNVLITGASSGIGEQLAYKYASMGANVLITARREHLLKQVVEKCKTLGPQGGKYGYYAADMTDYRMKSKIVIEKAVSFLGGLDTVIINHGMPNKRIVWYGSQEELDILDNVMSVATLSCIHIASHALPYLKTSSKFGRLGITSGLLGKTGASTFAPLVASKFALDGFFSSLRTELTQAKQNVSITLHLLGLVDTAGSRDFMQAEAKRLQLTPGDAVVRDLTQYTVQPDNTAYQIIRSTELGHAELYYPYWFGATKFPYPASLIPVIRHLLGSEYSQIIEMTPQFYEKYEQKFQAKTLNL